MNTSIMRAAFAVAVGVQIVLVGVSALVPNIGGGPATILGLLTIAVLLRAVKRVPEPNVEAVIEKKVEERTKQLEAQVTHFERVSVTDALTGLLNRRGIEDSINPHLARSRRLKTAFSFILCDIDNFKKVNDTFGHAVGDAVIAGVAKTMKDNLRVSDFAGRWGGEEYLICLPDTDLAGAILVAEKLRLAIEKLRFEDNLVATISMGCAELGEDSFEIVLARADMNLYLAKSKGRNKVFPDSLKKMLDST